MNIYQTQLEEQIYNLIEPEMNTLGYETVRIRMMGSARNKTLQIMLDRIDEIAITVDDCETASRQISVLLDVEEVIRSFYNLEVSSPGICRPLTRKKDFFDFAGEPVKIVSKLAINGQKNFSGLLHECGEDGIVIKLNDSDLEVKLAYSNISDAHLYPVFNFKQEKPNLKKRRK